MSVALLQPVFGFSIAGLLSSIVNYGFFILLGFVIAWVLTGWFPQYPSNRFLQGIYDLVREVVTPMIMPIRERIPMLRLGGFGLDLSPILLIIGLWIARGLLNLIIENFIGPVTG
jgi:YggT family protein